MKKSDLILAQKALAARQVREESQVLLALIYLIVYFIKYFCVYIFIQY